MHKTLYNQKLCVSYYFWYCVWTAKLFKVITQLCNRQINDVVNDDDNSEMVQDWGTVSMDITDDLELPWRLFHLLLIFLSPVYCKMYHI